MDLQESFSNLEIIDPIYYVPCMKYDGILKIFSVHQELYRLSPDDMYHQTTLKKPSILQDGTITA